jgi:hypothetical protein
MAHDPTRLGMPRPPKEKVIPYLKEMLKGLNAKIVRIHEVQSLRSRLPSYHRKLMDALAQTNHRNMVSQLYLINQSVTQIASPSDYDLVFRLRPDNLFVMPFSDLLPLDEIRSINFGSTPGAYANNRVYDIFFGVTANNMELFERVFDEIETNLNFDFDNKQDRVDACRLIAAQAIRLNINISSFNYRYTDVFREGSVENYIGYLNKLEVFNTQTLTNSGQT